MSRTKIKSDASICDIYIQQLYNDSEEGIKSETLPAILSNKNIYYDFKIIQRVQNFLLDKNYIKRELKNDIAYHYLPVGMQIPKNIVDHLKSSKKTYYHLLTEEGEYFVKNHQVIDQDQIIEKKEYRKKWKYAGIEIVVGVVVAYIVLKIS